MADALHARLQARLLVHFTGLLFARGKRTVASWLRAAAVGEDYKSYYYFLGGRRPGEHDGNVAGADHVKQHAGRHDHGLRADKHSVRVRSRLVQVRCKAEQTPLYTGPALIERQRDFAAVAFHLNKQLACFWIPRLLGNVWILLHLWGRLVRTGVRLAWRSDPNFISAMVKSGNGKLARRIQIRGGPDARCRILQVDRSLTDWLAAI